MQKSDDTKTVKVIAASAAETEALGEVVGAQLRGGEVIALASDLGGGKTTFVRGLARGAGSQDHVASPTFTVSKLYQAQSGHKNIEIYHFDFYRLQEAGIMRNELAELIGDPLVVIVVEWSDIVSDVLPEERLNIQISAVGDSESKREISVTYSTSLAYLTKGIEG